MVIRKYFLGTKLFLPTCFLLPLTAALLSASGVGALADDHGWVVLIGPEGPTGLIGAPKNGLAADAKLAENGRGLKPLPGKGVVVTRRNLVSKQKFGDCRVHLEFMIGGRSNSGVKLQRRYEIQLYDSHGRENPTARDCGGIYPHWKFGPGRLDYLDEGVPPTVNAAKPAGQWQTLEIVFRAPRFDQQGEMTKNARFESVVLNGQLIHKDVELESPTGRTPHPLSETAEDALYLQGDHGPVAFRNVKVYPLK